MNKSKGGKINMKELVLDVTKTLPDNSSLEEIIDAIIVRVAIEKGMKDFEDGNFITQNDLLEEIKKW